MTFAPIIARQPARERHEAERLERLSAEQRQMLRANNFLMLVLVGIVVLVAWMVLA